MVPNIQFTLEKEVNDRIAFLNTVLQRIDGRIEFAVHRKPCHKHDYIHFYYAHSRTGPKVQDRS